MKRKSENSNWAETWLGPFTHTRAQPKTARSPRALSSSRHRWISIQRSTHAHVTRHFVPFDQDLAAHTFSSFSLSSTSRGRARCRHSRPFELHLLHDSLPLFTRVCAHLIYLTPPRPLRPLFTSLAHDLAVMPHYLKTPPPPLCPIPSSPPPRPLYKGASGSPSHAEADTTTHISLPPL